MGNKTVNYFIPIIKRSEGLRDKEKEILIQRLKTRTLKRIGKSYRLTAERIRQIEKRALLKFSKKVAQLKLFK